MNSDATQIDEKCKLPDWRVYLRAVNFRYDA